MTRKDYIALAAALKAQQPASTWCSDKHAQYTLDVRGVAEALANDNPRFNYGRFYEAAGLVQEGPGTYARSLHEHSSACDCQQTASETP